MNEKPGILIVEDDADLVAAMKRILESKGYKAIVAFDPEEGNEKLKLEIPDLIILDVMFGSRGESKGFNLKAGKEKKKNWWTLPKQAFNNLDILVPCHINDKLLFYYNPQKLISNRFFRLKYKYNSNKKIFTM